MKRLADAPRNTPTPSTRWRVVFVLLLFALLGQGCQFIQNEMFTY